jgi:hypothetical protein
LFGSVPPLAVYIEVFLHLACLGRLEVIMKYNYTLNCAVLLLSKGMTTCLGVTMVRRENYQNNSHVITLPMNKMLNKSTWKICSFEDRFRPQ